MKTSKFKPWYFQNQWKFWTQTSWGLILNTFKQVLMKNLWILQFLGTLLASSKKSFYKVNRANSRILYRVSVPDYSSQVIFAGIWCSKRKLLIFLIFSENMIKIGLKSFQNASVQNVQLLKFVTMMVTRLN